MCAHLMLFTAICRPNLSVLEETGAWDIGFLIGGMGPVYSDQVTPGQCVCWGRVTALILVGLPLSQLALERHAIFCMWPKLLEFWGVIMRCSFILLALVQMHVCMVFVFGILLVFICFRVVSYAFLLFCFVQFLWHFVAVFPLPPLGLAVCKSGICIGFSLILVC